MPTTISRYLFVICFNGKFLDSYKIQYFYSYSITKILYVTVKILIKNAFLKNILPL